MYIRYLTRKYIRYISSTLILFYIAFYLETICEFLADLAFFFKAIVKLAPALEMTKKATLPGDFAAEVHVPLSQTVVGHGS